MSGFKTKVRKLKRMLQYLCNELPVKIAQLEGENARLEEQIQGMNLQATQLNTRVEQLNTGVEQLNARTGQLNSQAGQLISQAEDLLSSEDFCNQELNTLLLSQDRSKKRVLIIGFYGGYNLGDELMLETLLEHLRKRDDLSITVMLSENASYNASLLGDVEILHYCRTYSDYSHLAGWFDALVIGGGALLDDVPYQSMNRHYLSLATTVAELPGYFSARGKKTVVLGLSTNAVLSKEAYLSALSRSVCGAAYFSVRDPYSLQTLAASGIRTDLIKVIDDLVLASPAWLEKVRTGSGDGRHLAVTWVNFKELQPLLIRLLETLTQKEPEIRIDLIPMYEYCHADTRTFHEMMENLPDRIQKRIRICAQPQNMQEAIRQFSKADAALNIRYHAALICGSLGIPQTVLKLKGHPHYENKMRWIEDTFRETAEMLTTAENEDIIAESILGRFGAPGRPGIPEERIRRNMDNISGIINTI